MDLKTDVLKNKKNLIAITAAVILLIIVLSAVLYIRNFDIRKKAEGGDCTKVTGICRVEKQDGMQYEPYFLIVRNDQGVEIARQENGQVITFIADTLISTKYSCNVEPIDPQKPCRNNIEASTPNCFIPITYRPTENPTEPPRATDIPPTESLPTEPPPTSTLIPTQPPPTEPPPTEPPPTATIIPSPTMPPVCPVEKVQLFNEQTEVTLLCPGCACTGDTCTTANDCRTDPDYEDFVCVEYDDGDSECIRDSAQKYCANLRQKSVRFFRKEQGQ